MAADIFVSKMYTVDRVFLKKSEKPHISDRTFFRFFSSVLSIIKYTEIKAFSVRAFKAV